jgi:hypothetical protein
MNLLRCPRLPPFATAQWREHENPASVGSHALTPRFLLVLACACCRLLQAQARKTDPLSDRARASSVFRWELRICGGKGHLLRAIDTSWACAIGRRQMRSLCRSVLQLRTRALSSSCRVRTHPDSAGREMKHICTRIKHRTLFTRTPSTACHALKPVSQLARNPSAPIWF